MSQQIFRSSIYWNIYTSRWYQSTSSTYANQTWKLKQFNHVNAIYDMSALQWAVCFVFLFVYTLIKAYRHPLLLKMLNVRKCAYMRCSWRFYSLTEWLLCSVHTQQLHFQSFACGRHWHIGMHVCVYCVQCPLNAFVPIGVYIFTNIRGSSTRNPIVPVSARLACFFVLRND